MASLFTCKFPSILQPSTPPIPLQHPNLKNLSTPSFLIPTFQSRTQHIHITHTQNPSSPSLQALESLSPVVTDDSVPEGHSGLHEFLYGEHGSEVHGSDNQQRFTGKVGEDDGSSILPFQDYVKSRENSKLVAVYAVYNTHDKIQYVGYSRNVVLSLKSHMDRVGPSKCSSVRVKMFTDSSMASRGILEEEKKKWIDEFGTPPGNSIDKDLWESGQRVPTNVMSEDERKEYEEKKLKMRKAMGENLNDDVEGEDEDSRIRRLNLLRATEGDDWSEVIDGQTKETLEGNLKGSDSENNGTKDKGQAGIVSPLSGNGARGLYSAETFDLTLENVDLVLNDVRPYLISDGGNVEVASVEDGVIFLRLQGACGTCPSSTTTMKMGIERVLKEKFGDALKGIHQVDQQNITATVEAVNAHLDMLRPAIHNYGGSVEVISVEGENCHVKYNGPDPIGKGIQAAIKDKFSDITNVTLSNS
eukprot:Gb_03585 [translate_table: standard]